MEVAAETVIGVEADMLAAELDVSVVVPNMLMYDFEGRPVRTRTSRVCSFTRARVAAGACRFVRIGA